MLQIARRDQLRHLTDDYGSALLHVAWYREDRRRFLLFGMVELVPTELPPPDQTTLQSHPVRSRGRQHHIYLRRIPMAVPDALDWYAQALLGTVVVPDGRPDPPHLAVTSFAQEPVWPYLVATHTLPAVSTAVRAHFALQRMPPPEAFYPLEDASGSTWLAERLHFPLDKHREWLGAVCLAAPNPVLRELHHTLGATHDEEFSDLHLVARSGCTLNGLTLHLAEHRPSGLIEHRTVAVTDPYLRVAHVGRTEAVGLTLVCAERGVLEWHEPLPFQRTISFEMSLTTAEKEVVVPATRKRPAERYRIRVDGDAGRTVVGEQDGEPPIAAVLRAAEMKRARQKEVAQAGQRLFRGNHAGAVAYVRTLIGQARERVIIADPYFAARELFSVVFATGREGVGVTILTSAKCLQDPEPMALGREKGDVLLEYLTANRSLAAIDAFVMTGSEALVHDRFLVIDRSVWMLGNSLNEIGERASVIIKLPDPDPVIRLLLDAPTNSERVMPLEPWVAARVANRGNGCGELETP